VQHCVVTNDMGSKIGYIPFMHVSAHEYKSACEFEACLTVLKEIL